ncbi:13547_t:CDS:2 [Cetraspora pellucida]|uniref:13547_t:CDS:1 n=1 Tax=Cetraspora pellucida TaxID=1433469 RepID=A0ACA9LTS6_9GLOM|nr:13547_t:CDS:2 [Cetraspora pellucida]
MSINSSSSLFKSYNHNANEDIVINIHEGDTETMHDAGNIMPDMSLSEVQEEYKVSEILDQKNCIHILEDPNMSGLFRLINKHHLFRGRYLTSDSMEFKIAQQDAFKFKTNRKISQDSNIALMNSRTTQTAKSVGEVGCILTKNLFSTNNASDIFGINFEENQASNYEFDILGIEKCSIIIRPDEIEPTEKFKDAIKEALDQKTDELIFNKINQLSEIFVRIILQN